MPWAPAPPPTNKKSQDIASFTVKVELPVLVKT
jgi:hypothetical protein